MKARAGLILIAAFLVLAAVESSAQKKATGGGEVDAWFSEPGHEAYGAVKPAAEKAAEAVRGAGVPESLLVERLAEGSAKKVSMPVLERALQEEAGRLVEAAALLDPLLHGVPDEERTEMLREGAFALRGGMERQTMEEALAWRVEAGVDLRRTVSALAAVASLKRGLALSSADELRLVRGLALSREKPQRFGSFVSLLAGTRARGVATETILDVTLTILSRGGTFLTLQQELERRSRK